MAKHKKKKGLFILIIILLLAMAAGGFAGYNFLSGHMDILSKDLSSQDERFTMSVPFSWKKSSGASANAIIAAENSNNTMYAMVSVDRSYSNNGATVEEYIYDYINKIAENSDNPLVQVVSIPPTQGKLGENTGYYFELDSMSNGLAIHLWDFVFVADGGYVHVDVASAGEEIKSSADTAKGIISSVTFNSPTAVTPEPVA